MYKKLLISASVLGFGLVSMTSIASANSVTVKQGDTVSELAQENNTTVESIKELNNLSNVNLIYIGDTLNVNDSQVSQNVVAQTPQSKQSVQNIAPVQPIVKYTSNNSVKEQFIEAGGSEAMWDAIVIPESSGNVNASNGQYHGLFQTNQSWGYGSVASQTQCAINYANSRYGSVSKAIQFRLSNGWW